jgi:hypothetical protein
MAVPTPKQRRVIMSVFDIGQIIGWGIQICLGLLLILIGMIIWA